MIPVSIWVAVHAFNLSPFSKQDKLVQTLIGKTQAQLVTCGKKLMPVKVRFSKN